MKEYIRTKKMVEMPIVEGIRVVCDVCKKTIFDSREHPSGSQDWYEATMDTHYTPDGIHFIPPTLRDYCSNECLSKEFLDYMSECYASRSNAYSFHVEHVTDETFMRVNSEKCDYSKKGITRG